MKKQECCCYQDLWQNHRRRQHEQNECTDDTIADDEIDVSSDVFFQLANAPLVSYRLPSTLIGAKKNEDARDSEIPLHRPNEIVIVQDVEGAAQKHTGGIVWETAYLLLEYLLCQLKSNVGIDNSEIDNGQPNVFSFLQRKHSNRSTSIVEVGAGCGMLGLTLHRALELAVNQNNLEGNKPCRVILTETNEVMDNLRRNFHRNCPTEKDDNISPSYDPSFPPAVSVFELDWTSYQEHCQDAGMDAHSVDLILGTDVVFSTRFVEPLLQTMEYLCHENGMAILCLQERCPDSHALLLDKANKYGFVIEDISERVFDDYSCCRFGRDLDCKLLQFTRESLNKAKKEKKRKTPKKLKKTKRSESKDKKPRLQEIT
ncbi:lysine methyltransferase [Nitzschia inconspicua]|uniref:Lysine methyltransferase n=1 Tax=Nitzschia inconspicua TaxID=303405 RepID=A0A9K3LP62_9STRA|nr:lysine methyltransferase [Nitzschia inconspicua]